MKRERKRKTRGRGRGDEIEKRSLIEEARERQVTKAASDQADYLAYLRMQAESHDPKVRERAEELLTKESARVPA